jgi:hypothetical protein
MLSKKPMRYWVGVAVASLLGLFVLSMALFDEDNFQSLGGGYYTASYDEGTALHWHENPEKFADAPLLDKLYDTQRNDSYVVARAGTDFYFAFPLRASTLAEVQQNRLGPFSKAELTAKMMQLTGDSTLQQVGSF